MLLSKRTILSITGVQENYIGHMNYAAMKLWNFCNYERQNYKTLGLSEYPDWYYQKSVHKGNVWFQSLPSQTAQEICKLLDGAWKSFYALKETGGIENPGVPGFKHNKMPITYMQNAIVQDKDEIRLSIPKQLKKYMFETYQVNEQFLYLKNSVFQVPGKIKQLKLYPPKNRKMEIIIIYEIPDIGWLPDNGHYLSIDLGLHNLMTCMDSLGCNTFIIGREYLSICRKYDKEISRVQKEWDTQQTANGVKQPKTSKHIQKLYAKKNRCVKDYLHKVTHAVLEYCLNHHIHTVVIGDITGIRKDNDLGNKGNQKLHSLPFRQIYQMLEYKLAKHGIRLVKQIEAYSSQCSPRSKSVCKKYANKKNRQKRGLYKDGAYAWNADCVGAYNILRLYFKQRKKDISLTWHTLSMPEVIKVAV